MKIAILKWVLSVLAVLAILGAAYAFGSTNTANKWRAVVANMNEQQANVLAQKHAEAAALDRKYRDREQQHAIDMAAIDNAYQQEIIKRETISNRTIADLRGNVVRLRDKFTCACDSDSAAGTATPGTAPGIRDAAASLNLRAADAEFLVRLADEADAVADQLKQCQAVVQSDRSIHQDK